MSVNDWLNLNVGGKIFMTTRSTLISCPNSTLSKMFDPTSGYSPAYRNDHGVYFLDADPDCFKVILYWLRLRYLAAGFLVMYSLVVKILLCFSVFV